MSCACLTCLAWPSSWSGLSDSLTPAPRLGRYGRRIGENFLYGFKGARRAPGAGFASACRPEGPRTVSDASCGRALAGGKGAARPGTPLVTGPAASALPLPRTAGGRLMCCPGTGRSPAGRTQRPPARHPGASRVRAILPAHHRETSQDHRQGRHLRRRPYRNSLREPLTAILLGSGPRQSRGWVESESLVSNGLCGPHHHLFGGQPLAVPSVIRGPTPGRRS